MKHAKKRILLWNNPIRNALGTELSDNLLQQIVNHENATATNFLMVFVRTVEKHGILLDLVGD